MSRLKLDWGQFELGVLYGLVVMASGLCAATLVVLIIEIPVSVVAIAFPIVCGLIRLLTAGVRSGQ